MTTLAAMTKPKTRSRRSTSSRRAARGSVPREFEAFAEILLTENGGPLRLEPWQRVVLGDYFAGAREVLVLLPKGNGKTTLFAALALYHLLVTPDAKCYIAAASRDQASLMYDHARGFVKRTPGLEERLAVKAGYREIRRVDGLGSLKVLASDADTADGVGPTLALVDELHRHKTPHLYQVFRDGLGKRGGQLATISTAGDHDDTPLGRMRRAALELPDQRRDGFHLRAATADGKFCAHEWAVPDGADTSDLGVVKRANPSSFVTEELLRERRDSPSMHERDWLRYACNQWVPYTEPWLPAGLWAACEERGSIPDGASVVVGVDVGVKKDSSAVVMVESQPGEAGFRRVECEVFRPAGDGTPLDLGLVEDAVRRAADRCHVVEVVYDRWSFERSAQTLGDEGLLMVDFPMTNSRMAPATQRLFEAIKSRALRHDGDPVLAAHVEAGFLKPTERGDRLTKGKASRPIDALMALLIGWERAEGAAGGVPTLEWIA